MYTLRVDHEEMRNGYNWSPWSKNVDKGQMIIWATEIKYKFTASKDHYDFMWSFQVAYFSNLSSLNSSFPSQNTVLFSVEGIFWEFLKTIKQKYK